MTHIISILLFFPQRGYSALITASDLGHKSAVEILLKAGANPNLKTYVRHKTFKYLVPLDIFLEIF